MDDALRTRLMAKVAKSPNGCWLWTAATNPKGYGRAWVSHRLQYPHRVLYEDARGPIPPGYDIDHLCRNHGCCNPEHLEAVSRSENLSRGVGPAKKVMQGLLKTHCSNGHELTPENTRFKPIKGKLYRYCRTCRKGAPARTRTP